HHARDGLRVVIRHSRLKQIAHRVHEHQLGRSPRKRLRKLLRHQPKIKPLFVRMPLDPAKPLRKCLGIAVFASRANLDAAADGIPGRVGPLDMRIEAHLVPLPTFSFGKVTRTWSAKVPLRRLGAGGSDWTRPLSSILSKTAL